MRFGRESTLAFDLEPVVPSWDCRTPSEQGPWARLIIWFRGENLCRTLVQDSASVHEGVYVPLAPIADWLVRNARYIAYEESARAFPTDANLHAALELWKSSAPASPFAEEDWDDLHWEWSDRHFLHAGTEGSWLPNLSVVRVDDDLWLSLARCRFATPEAPSFLYVPTTDRVPWEEAKQTLTDFVEYIREELQKSGLATSYPWIDRPNPFAQALDIGLQEYTRDGLGLDPTAFEKFSGLSLGRASQTLNLSGKTAPENSATFQALRDLELEPGIWEPLVAEDLSSRVQHGQQFARVRRSVIEALEVAPPEAQGYSAARNLRRGLGLERGPLEGVEGLAMQLAIEVRPYSVDTDYDHAAALGHREGLGKVLLFNSPKTRDPWARNMEVLRGMGHLLLDGGADQLALGAGSSRRATGPRRRRSGAFAAEMLLPQDAIHQRTGGVLDVVTEPEVFESLMKEYGVGATTAAWQSYNAGLLSSRERVDELIGEYGRAA